MAGICLQAYPCGSSPLVHKEDKTRGMYDLCTEGIEVEAPEKACVDFGQVSGWIGACTEGWLVDTAGN